MVNFSTVNYKKINSKARSCCIFWGVILDWIKENEV